MTVDYFLRLTKARAQTLWFLRSHRTRLPRPLVDEHYASERDERR